MDSAGELADWATLEHADVGMTVNGAVWQVASAAFTEPGILEVTYVVEEGGAEEMEVGVSLRGVTVPGGPWRPHAGFMAKGVLLATLTLQSTVYSGLAVSSDGKLMVACNPASELLSVYLTQDGSHVRSFGGRGQSPGNFMGIGGIMTIGGAVCMTARDTVLVAEYDNNRIQEVTLEGVHVRFFPLDGQPRGVAVHGDLLAVTMSLPPNSLHLYNYTTGALVRAISTEFSGMCGMCFAPGGEQLAVGGYSQPITLISVYGQARRHIGRSTYWRIVAFTCTGDVIGVTMSSVSVFSATDGMLLRSWTADNSGGTVSGNRLYLLKSGRVQVFQ